MARFVVHRVNQSKWPPEEIPDEDHLYYRIHKNFLRTGGKIVGACFVPQGPALSCDWCKYSTSKETLNRAKVPYKNIVVSFVVRELREISLTVTHTPSQTNRAHTDVKDVRASYEQLEARDRMATFAVVVEP